MNKILFLLIPVLCVIGCGSVDTKINGYVEGEFVMIGPTSSGVLEKLFVERGQIVNKGDKLFSLELTDLITRQKSTQADISRLEVELINTQKEYDRIFILHEEKMASTAHLETAETALNNVRARLDSANQTLVQIDRKIEEDAPKSPANAIIQDTYYEVGEYVHQGQPVVSILPPNNINIRFFVAQKIVTKIKLGQFIKITCDGCTAPIKANISYISPNSEYTPPVIYSVESRDKLVFLVEAKPVKYYEFLRPGLPVSIELEG